MVSFLIQQFNCQPQYLYGNPPDSIPLWFAAREDNTLSSRLTRSSLFPSESFNFFNEYCHLAWDSTRLPNKKDTVSGVSFVMHRIWKFICQPQFPYGNPPDSFPLGFAAREDNTLSSRLTRPFQASTFGVCELNFRVGMGATTTSCRCWLPFN